MAQKKDKIFDTTPPQHFGANVDNRNFNTGTAMYYKVQIKGAEYYAGDSHFAQGDEEYWVTHGMKENLDAALEEAAMEAIHFLTHHKDMSREEANSFPPKKSNRGINTK